jgi:hypothetical protein
MALASIGNSEARLHHRHGGMNQRARNSVSTNLQMKHATKNQWLVSGDSFQRGNGGGTFLRIVCFTKCTRHHIVVEGSVSYFSSHKEGNNSYCGKILNCYLKVISQIHHDSHTLRHLISDVRISDETDRTGYCSGTTEDLHSLISRFEWFSGLIPYPNRNAR